VVRDFESHSGSDLERPGLVYAIERLEAGEATCLVVASLERLTRSAAHLGTLIDRLSASGIRLVVLDIQLDTGNPDGRLAAEALASVGTLERRNLDVRTRKGLQAAREGRRSGRPAVADRPALKERIAEMRARGMTLQAIADTLNTEGVPTLRGGTEWRPSSVQAAVGYKRPKRGAGKTDGGTVDSDSGSENNGGSAGSTPGDAS
jgi:DNA invertase Pin-like site-specific DNA recombinase